MLGLKHGVRTALWGCVLLALTACGQQPSAALQGYVEGEPSLLAAASAGYLASLSVAAGDAVQKGQTLFALDGALETQALEQAQAQAQGARARAQNLQQPRRTPEIVAAQAQVQSAQAALQLSQLQYKRQQQLAQSGFVSDTVVDAARTAQERDQAALANAQAQLATLQLQVGRQQEVHAAQQDATSAQAAMAQARTRLTQKTVQALTAGQVQDTYYRVGEWVQAGAPVVSVLSPDQIKIRFFVPEGIRARYPVGTKVKVSCDACAQVYDATVRFVSAQAEYTPPVIYSRQVRDKLVYMVEATPDDAARKALMPGQPVDVNLP